MSTHESHPDIIKRLKRAHGHLASVIAMLDDNRGCLDVAQQLHAVEKAVANAKHTLIHDHIDHCLDHAAEGGKAGKQSMLEFKEITKYL